MRRVCSRVVQFADGDRLLPRWNPRPRVLDRYRGVEDPERTFGLYLDTHWQATWPAAMVDWKDFGLPENRELAARQIVEAFGRAQHGGSSRSAVSVARSGGAEA
jgi:hypothetical protein